ncbi:hypothetical protein BcepF1.047 [Burkholderia phage BcepF1]|uniref:Uncharacterized protein n=1 Tax=Burkholderia phage BcepF1 TaxID=2886897 RepID=A1YZV1_9CAUD|nr:hypothetical protein BcepF1.047 [Burkholderia phage BcepF1]ABL96778.1 hypothetical protein BcepF1.047 [Burkholderia phage BcepF1]
MIITLRVFMPRRITVEEMEGVHRLGATITNDYEVQVNRKAEAAYYCVRPRQADIIELTKYLDQLGREK